MLALLISLVLSPAHAAGGGGLVLHQISLDRAAPDAPAPGDLQCSGGLGVAVGDSGWRLGGEGHACHGGAADLAFGGIQLGKQHRHKRVYTGWTVGLGGGGLSATTSTGGQSGSAFAYTRPGAFVGLPLGIGSIELGAYAMLPVVQIYDHVENPGVTRSNLGHAGLQASFLFGNLGRRRPEPEPEPVVVQAPPPPPATVVVEVQAYSFEDILVPEDDDPRPLAITEPDHPAPLE